jgi:hypothetical protein
MGYRDFQEYLSTIHYRSVIARCEKTADTIIEISKEEREMTILVSSRAFAVAAWTIGGLIIAEAVVASTVENAIDTTGLPNPVGVSYGDHTINSGFADVVEVDSYRFQGTAGGSVRTVVSSLSGGLDPQIELRDPTGVVIDTVFCNGSFSSLCSINLDAALTSTGTYTLNVSDVNSDESGNYSLHIDAYPPADNWVGFAYDSPVIEELGHVSDMDFLAFSGAAGTEVRLIVRSLTGGLDPQLEVWDPQGNLISDTFCNGSFSSLCTTSADLMLSSTGTYTIGLTDVGWNETGNYDLGISCLFGDCPSGAPTAPSTLVNLEGTVKATDGTDICAMVLASGQFMFSCNPPGVFSLTELPRDNDSTVKRQIYADGFFPKVDTLTGSSNAAVVMVRSGTCPSYNAPYDPGVFLGSAGNRINISGEVLLQDSQTPICAMVLANGQHVFSCDDSGSYALNIPLDSNGQFKLQVYADGFAPVTQTFDEFQSINDVRMARALECP